MPLQEVVYIREGTRFRVPSVPRAYLRKHAKSGSDFYELIERPMKVHDKAIAAPQRSRRSRKQNRALQKKEWAERVLKGGFSRVPSAADILGPMMDWKMARDLWA